MKFPQKVYFPVDKSPRTCYNQTNKSNDEEEYASPLSTEKRRSVQVFRQTMRKVASELRVRTSYLISSMRRHLPVMEKLVRCFPYDTANSGGTTDIFRPEAQVGFGAFLFPNADKYLRKDR